MAAAHSTAAALADPTTSSVSPSAHFQQHQQSYAKPALVIQTSDPLRHADASEESPESPSHSQFTFTPRTSLGSSCTSQEQSLSSSPRRYPTDLTVPIPEECDETASESPNEPITPVSDRQSRDFDTAVEQHDLQQRQYPTSFASLNEVSPEQPTLNAGASKPPLLVHTAATPPRKTPQTSPTPKSRTPIGATTPPTESASNLRRPSTRGSGTFPTLRRKSSGFSIKMTNLFRRTNSNITESATVEFRQPNYGVNNDSQASTPVKLATSSSQNRFSFRKSNTTTRSHTPPSPGSPLEMARTTTERTGPATMLPSSDDFLDNTKKNRVGTGFSFRGRVNFASNGSKNQRRTRSVERKKKHPEVLEAHPYAIAPDYGTGMKARRLSLSLPDDFTVDVTELSKEYEYPHKFFARHHKKLGAGATAKVGVMMRIGSPGELYAVKEFRPKKGKEDDYETKIKSEYSIAKSLHHPNIVETIRLCTDHGRWNHVMEYCAEGDLYSLVCKKYLKDETRESDRLCLFKQLLQGVNYLHSNGIAHRDIKLDNLLITKDSKLKITDFGVSEVFSGIHPGLREAGGQCGQQMNGEIRRCKPGICGSIPYIAPEVLSKNGDYDPRPLDVWSSAVVMIYLTFGANIWDRASLVDVTKQGELYPKLVQAWEKFETKKANHPDLPKEAMPRLLPFDMAFKTAALRRLMFNMLNPDPDKRITVAEIVNSRWMKNVECCQLESYDDPVMLIDASKKDCTKTSAGKIYCHNHLPLQSSGHGLPPMPGKAGY